MQGRRQNEEGKGIRRWKRRMKKERKKVRKKENRNTE
jgi:hypothetical protein